MGFFFELRKGSLFSLSLIRFAQIYDFWECPKVRLFMAVTKNAQHLLIWTWWFFLLSLMS